MCGQGTRSGGEFKRECPVEPAAADAGARWRLGSPTSRCLSDRPRSSPRPGLQRVTFGEGGPERSRRRRTFPSAQVAECETRSLDQALQLVGFAVNDPGNDDGPEIGFIRVEHSPVPYAETPCLPRRPFQTLDLPSLNSYIAINRLVYSRPYRRIESHQALGCMARIRDPSLQRPNSRSSSSCPYNRPASISSLASSRRRQPVSLRVPSSSGASNRCRTNGSPRSARYSKERIAAGIASSGRLCTSCPKRFLSSPSIAVIVTAPFRT